MGVGRLRPAVKGRIRSICCAALLASVTVYPCLSAGQNGAPAESRAVSEEVLAFLKRMEPRATFTGEVIVIPNDLRESLERLFYLHRFTIVRMRRDMGISFMESELIVVTDAKSGKVVSPLWELGMRSTPESFKKLLTHYPETYDWRGAMHRIKVLSELLVYPDRDYEKSMGSRVGAFRYDSKGKVIEAELIASYKPYRLLLVRVEEVDGRLRFGRLAIVDPETRKEQ